MTLQAQQFRRLYQNLLDLRQQRFVVKHDSPDSWGIVITTKSVTHVQVWHNLQNSTLTLGLMGKGRSYVREAQPENATVEDTGKTLMFRWSVPKIDPTISPRDQPAMNEIIVRIKEAFDWVRSNRADPI